MISENKNKKKPQHNAARIFLPYLPRKLDSIYISLNHRIKHNSNKHSKPTGIKNKLFFNHTIIKKKHKNTTHPNKNGTTVYGISLK